MRVRLLKGDGTGYTVLAPISSESRFPAPEQVWRTAALRRGLRTDIPPEGPAAVAVTIEP